MVRTVLFCLTLFFLCAAVVDAEEQLFGGVGLQVVPTINGDLVVLNVLTGSPASAKGLRPGDLIYQVDHFELLGSEFGTVVSEYLWGAAGSSVVIHFRRPGKAGDKRVELVRAHIDPRMTVTPSVQSSGVQDRAGDKQ